MSKVTIKKMSKFQHFFAQILTFSAQISTFEIKIQNLQLLCFNSSIKDYGMKLSTICNVLILISDFNSLPIKSSEQMKFRSVKIRKFQNHLP